MDVEVYADILRERGIDPYLVQDKETELELTNAALAMRHDIIRKKTVWTNIWKQDWLLYLKNEHNLLSIFCAHDLHPYTRKEVSYLRFLIL